MLGKCCSWMRLRDIADTVRSEVAAAVLRPALASGRASLPLAPAALMLTRPPAKGAIPSRPSSFLLDTSIMAHSLLLAWRFSRHKHRVCAAGHNVPNPHHGVVFMHHVVAVDGILAQPVAEAEEEQDALVGMQLGHVLARPLNQRGRHPVAGEDLVLLEVDMDRVGPIAGSIEQDPVLHAVLLHQEAEMVAGHELPIDGPLAIQAVELEGTGDAGRRGGVRER